MEEKKVEKTKETDPKSKKSFWIATIGIGVVILLIYFAPSSSTNISRAPQNNAGVEVVPHYVELPTQGKVTGFIPDRWTPVVECYDTTKRISCTVVTQEKLITGWVRLDGNDSRVCPIYASLSESDLETEEIKNKKIRTALEIKKGASKVEIKFDSGQNLNGLIANWVIYRP